MANTILLPQALSIDVLTLSSCFKAAIDQAHFEFNPTNEEKATPTSSVKFVVGVVTGSLALVGLAAVMVGMTVFHSRRRKKNYEKIPLLKEE